MYRELSHLYRKVQESKLSSNLHHRLHHAQDDVEELGVGGKNWKLSWLDFLKDLSRLPPHSLNATQSLHT